MDSSQETSKEPRHCSPRGSSDSMPRSLDGVREDRERALEEKDIEARPALLRRVTSEAPYTIFSKRTKIFIVFMVAISALVSPLAATVYYPALNPLAQQLHVSNSLINLSITTYMILQAIAPALMASISDTSGRRLSFLLCFTIFTIANIGLALQTSYPALLILRMVQASGSSGTIALSIAVVADISTSAERGKYVGYATAGILLGPAFGPTIGGALAQYLGWRSIFWFLAIFTGCYLIIFVFFFPETCRKVVNNGSIPAKGVNLSILGYLRRRKHAGQTPEPSETLHIRSSREQNQDRKRRCNWPNPLLTLRILKDKESALLLIYNALAFSGQMIITASLPSMLAAAPYHYNDLKVGLCFLPIGSGGLCASIAVGHVMDWNFRRHARRCSLEIRKGRQQDLRNFPIERARVEVIVPNHLMSFAAMIAFGWLVERGVHIAAVEVVMFCLGFFVMSAFNVSNALLVDLHRDSPATATAAVNLTRCLVSAGGVAVIIPMSNAMGRGWAFTVLAAVYVLLSPCLWVLVRWGPGWRAERCDMERLRKAENERTERQ